MQTFEIVPEIVGSEASQILTTGPTPERAALVGRWLAEKLTDDERSVFADWLGRLLAIRYASACVRTKLARALRTTASRQLVVSVLKATGRPLVELAWEDRTWAVRFAALAALVATTQVQGQRAGVALMGTAFGVPLWVVFAGSGALAGVILEEMLRSPLQRETGWTVSIVD